jgi:hypothetical protein
MDNLIDKIQKIESDIHADLDQLKMLGGALSDKVNSIKTSFALTEMLVMGFTLGYMIAPGKNAVIKPTRLASLIILVKIRKTVRAMTSYLFRKF